MSTNSTQAHQVPHKLLVGTVSGRGFGRAECSNAGVVKNTHEHKCFESREPVEVPHWDEKDSIRTLIDLNEKMACGSGIRFIGRCDPNS